jgi:acetyl-CoA synthetase
VEHAKSVEDPAAYWSTLGKSELDWFHPFSSAMDPAGKLEDGSAAWFVDGKMNVCYNAVDRHVLAGRGGDIAIRWEGDDASDTKNITFSEVQKEVCRIANAFVAKGVQKGDVVTIYMPMIPELAYTMLACARMGAVHSVIFAGFSADSITDRIYYSRSKFVCTTNTGLRGGRALPLKQIMDTALSSPKLNGQVTPDGEPPAAPLEAVFVFRHYGTPEDTLSESYLVAGRDLDMSAYLETQRPYCACEWMDSEDSLFLLYTSGSTGKPKGLVHTTGGYALFAKLTTQRSFDLRKDDVYACVADCGWITGHTYIVYGPLLNGFGTFMFEGTPMAPDAGRYWDMVQRHKISVFYTAPTAIRSLMRYGSDIPAKYDKSSLRVLGTVGEPINPEAWRWYYEVIGNKQCTIADTYWQTETGGHVVTNLPGITPMKPGSCTLPFYGIDAVVLDPQTGQELCTAGDVTTEAINGVLAIKQPWPGMARTCLGDHHRYLQVYMQPYPGYYFTGDGCRKDADGYIWITGRVDDVLNVSGHRIGTAEVESALVAHPAVAQAAVVGFPHDIKGQGLCCYATLTVEYSDHFASENREQYNQLVKELRQSIRTTIGAFATPDMIIPAPSLPMTRSGKIMRRILRKIASNELDTLGDTSTLADPSVVDSLIALVEEARGGGKK